MSSVSLPRPSNCGSLECPWQLESDPVDQGRPKVLTLPSYPRFLLPIVNMTLSMYFEIIFKLPWNCKC